MMQLARAGWAHSLAVKADGTVVAWGYNDYLQTDTPLGLSNVVAVAGGAVHSLALKSDGTVVAWGNNDYGQADVPNGLSNALAIAAGAAHSLALKSDGTVVAWGNNDNGQTEVPSDMTNVVAITAGDLDSVALRADGSVRAWGDNSAGQTDVPSGLSNVVAVATSREHSLALWNKGSPSITVAPFTHTVYSGSTFSLNVKAAGGGFSLSYQWRRNGLTLPNATNAALAFTNAASGASADYSVVVSNALGVVTSAVAKVMIIDSAPLVRLEPTQQVASWGGSATFRPLVEGSSPATFQWQLNGTRLPEATNATLVLTNVQPSMRGSYSVVLSNAFGTTQSSEATLSVVPVWTCGANELGQSTLSPSLTNAIAVAAGLDFSLALKADGTVVAWGDHWLNQTGVPSGLSNVVAIAAAGDHSLALRTDGTVVGWGGLPPGVTDVPLDLTNVVAIAAGDRHSLALREDGTVLAWGVGGQAIVPSGLSNVIAVAAGSHHSLALKTDGTVAGWGADDEGQTDVPTIFSNVVAVAAGGDHSLLIRGDGRPFVKQGPVGQSAYSGATVSLSVLTVGPLLTSTYQWLQNSEAILGANAQSLILPNAMATQSGDYSVIVSNSLGAVTSSVAKVTIVDSAPLVNVESTSIISFGSSVTLGSAEGSQPIWIQWQFNGTNVPGATNASLELMNGQRSMTGAYSLSASNAFGTASFSNAMVWVVPVWAWTCDFCPPILPLVPALTNAVAIAGGAGDNTVALTADGTVVAWGNNAYGQADVPLGLSNVVAVAAGAWHSLALDVNGIVTAWGAGAMNDGTWPNLGQSLVPLGLGNVVAIAGGGAHSLALIADGTVIGWGSAVAGAPRGLSNVVALAAGGRQSVALKTDGTVVAWGYGGEGETAVPTGLSNVVAIASGEQHSLALKADGTVVGWGADPEPSTPPAGLSNVVAVAAGGYHSLALKADGTVVAWGDYEDDSHHYPMRVPSGLNNVVALAAGWYYSLALVGRPSFESDLSHVLYRNSTFRLSVRTVRGRSYRLESTDSLATIAWTLLPPVPGDGTVKVLSDSNSTASQRFYRVQVQ